MNRNRIVCRQIERNFARKTKERQCEREELALDQDFRTEWEAIGALALRRPGIPGIL